MNEGQFREMAISWLHQGAHVSTHDPEDTVLVALTQAELTACCLGTHLAHFSFPCLTPLLDELTAKLVQLIQAQRPEWNESEFWGEHGQE